MINLINKNCQLNFIIALKFDLSGEKEEKMNADNGGEISAKKRERTKG